MTSEGKVRATKMKMRRVVELFIIFFLICSNALLCSSLAHDLRPLMEEKQLIKNEPKRQRTLFKGLQEAVHVPKEKTLVVEDQNKKGKGSYGGGDLLRPRGKRSGANSLLPKSYSLLSTLLLLRYVLVGLLATVFFF